MIEISDVTKVYKTRKGTVHALDRIEFGIDRGEFVSLVGPSGCGKSTLLLMIAGLIPYTNGNIAVGGQKVESPHTEVGIAFQNPVLLDWLSIIDNVLLQVEMRGLRRRSFEPRAKHLLMDVGLDGFEHHYPYELSGGMKQRVAICRALVHDPPLLLLDEPFAAVDALTREQLALDLQKLWLETRQTVVFVTHSIPEAVFLSDRVLVMSAQPGRLVKQVDVGIARPRSWAGMEEGLFRKNVAEIRGIFESIGVLRGNES